MSKNVVIQEGGVGRQFTADKLTTALVGGGRCNWVPEDEIQLGTKSITENGTYIAANDGEYGYSQVTVNVSSAEKIITGTTDSGEHVVTTIDVVDGTISEIILGDYFIVTYDGDGNVAKIEDNNGNRCLLTYDGETMTGFDDIEDNHYTIIFDSDGNISQVIDPNAQDCELRDSDGDGKIDIISIGAVMQVIPDIETGDIKIIDENDNDVTDDYIGTSITGVDSDDTPWRANITESTSGDGASMGITPVTPATTPGASIIGTNIDGNTVKVSIGEDGSITEEVLPHSIEVVTPPTITTYADGANINFNGLTVAAYDVNGNKMQDVPFSELLFPVKVADYSKADSNSYAESSLVEGAIAFGAPPIRLGALTETHTMAAGGTAVFAIGDPVYGAGVASQEPGTMTRWEEWGTDPTHRNEIVTQLGQFAYGGKTVYWGGFTEPWSLECNLPGNSNVQRADLAAWTVIYGSIQKGGQHIPVQWQCPNSGMTYETSFDIIVEKSEEGGGGGDEGGGSSPVPEGITIQDLNIAIYNAMNAGQDHIEIDGQQYTIAEAQAMIDYLISH